MIENRKVVAFIATSLDGFIATKEESLEWLMNVEGEGDNGYSQFYETIDTVLMGRKTYDWLIKQDIGEFPYKGKDCYVFTRTYQGDTDEVKFINQDLVQFTKLLKQTDGKNVWIVGGGELLNNFLNEGLVDELIITVAPILIGRGIPLFNEREKQIKLTLKGSRHFNQFIELHYDVIV